MSSARRASLSVCLPLVGALATLAAADHTVLPLSGDTSIRLETPNLEFDKSGALIAPRGFVAHMGDQVLIGDALRYQQKDDDLFATGKVVLVIPGVRLHAARLGLHPKAQNGDAWEVEAFVEHAGRRIIITADRVHLDRTVLRFEGIHAISGHGGLVGFGATTALVHLREVPAPDRKGFERQVEGLELVSTTIRAAGVPVMWLPWLYRDFYYDYPWTRYEGGKTRRLGYYVRGWVGTSLLDIAGWHPHLEARGDMYSRTGEAWGVKGVWENPAYGRGEASYYGIPHEIVMGGADDRENIATRSAAVVDAEQQLHGLGGALYARWTSLPDTDPVAPGDPALPWDDRFRADYLRNDLEHRPFARQGVTGTWGTSLGTLTLDTERRANPEQPLTDRLWGVQAELPRLQLAGPLHLSGSGWSESLENAASNDAAVRTSFEGLVSAMQWFGPLGLDLGGGVQGLSYHHGSLAGVDQADQARVVPMFTAGVRTRFVGDWGEGLTHVFTPRLGLELFEPGTGDVLSPWHFGDPRDHMDEDLRLATAGFDTSLIGSRPLFRASAVARWGLREHDQLYTDVFGVVRTANSPLVDVTGSFEGSPIASLLLTGNFIYDAQREDWRTFDVGTSWVTSRWTALRYNGTLIPATATAAEQWQHRPGFTALANRYRLDGDITFRPGGEMVDQWLAQLSRRMVDGDLSFTYELIRNEDGVIYDRRFGVGFSMSVGGAAPHHPGTPTPAGFDNR